jgi:Glycosyltransferase
MIYVTYVDLFHTSYYGITKKIMSQIKTFQQYFGKVYYTFYQGRMMYLMDGESMVEKELCITKEKCNAAIDTWINQYGIQRIYVRYNFADKWFIQFLKLQKEKNIKLVLEIPTYPYDGEIKDKRRKAEDEYYRQQLYKYVDWVATNSDSPELWGMSCVKLLNGVDADMHPLHSKKAEDKRIVLIGVSSMAVWHGYERLLEGLHQYYDQGGEYDFLFKIVGDGAEKEKYCLLTEEYGLKSRVEFCGILKGEELNRQYEQADIAVSSLGLYKTGIQDVTPIKGAEYCVRGIPFICGYHDMRFPRDAEYIMTVSNDPEPIDMRQVFRFYKEFVSQEDLKLKMRDYAKEHFSWERIMMPIIELLK